MKNDIQPFLDNPQELVTQSIEVQLAVANNSATPRELLELLLASEKQEVATAAQNHVNWAGELTEDCHLEAEKLLRDSNLGQNDRLAVELLKFAPVPEWFLSEWVPADRLLAGVKNAYLPRRYRVQLLERLAKEPLMHPRLEAAEHPDTPVPILEKLAGDVELPVRVAVRYNPNCPRESIALAESQQAIAANWDTDAQQLAQLADSPWSWVRRAVAGNPSSPSAALEKLAEGDCYPVRLAVARNPSSPRAALEKLINIDDKLIRQALAKNPNASEAMLLQLLPTLEERDCEERDCEEIIVRRENLPVEVIERLVEESDRYYEILQQPNITTAIFRQMLARCYRYELMAMVSHPRANASLLEELATNKDAEVRLAVAQNPNAPFELRVRLLEESIVAGDRNINQKIAADPNTSVFLLELIGDRELYPNKLKRELKRVLDILQDRPPGAEMSANNNTFDMEDYEDEDLPLLMDPDLTDSCIEKIRQILSEFQVAADIDEWMGVLESLGLFSNLWRYYESDEWQYGQYEEKLYQEISQQWGKMLPALPQSALEELLAELWKILGIVTDTAKYRRSEAIALVGNPNTPAGLRDQLQAQLTLPPDSKGEIRDWDLRQALANNPAVPLSQRLEYIEEAMLHRQRGARWDPYYFLEKIAENPNTPTSILERLAERFSDLLSAIASNPNAPVSLLRQAAGSTSNSLLALAKNPNTPPDILAELALKGKSGVREAVFKHPALDTFAVYRIQLQLEERERKKEAYEAIARRRDSPWALAEVALSGNREARCLVASNSKTPLSALEQLLKAPQISVRAALANNSSLPLNWRLELTRDPSVSVRMELAEERYGRSTPVEVLETLAADESENVRVLVAQNRETPSSVLENLADDESQKVRRAVARNLNTPIPILKEIARNNPELKEEMLYRKPSGKEESDGSALRMQHRFLAELLQEFASSNDDSIRYCIAGHPNAPPGVLEQLAFDDDRLIRLDVAKHPKTPPQILTKMASQEKLTTRDGCFYTVSNNIAMRGDAPPEALDFVARQPVIPIRQETLGNRNTSADTLAWLAANESDINILCGIGRHPNVSGDVELQLSRHENQAVRGSLAASSYVSSILETLALDESQDVREQVATNSIAPVPLLQMLASDSAAEVRAAVAANASTPGHILERLARDEKVEVRRAVAENPATPTSIRESLRDLLPLKSQLSPTLRGLGRVYDPENDDLPSLLSEYARSPVAFVRFVALMHPLTAAKALAEGSQSLCWWERYAVACNRATPAEIRQRLAEDSDRIVRATAQLLIVNWENVNC